MFSYRLILYVTLLSVSGNGFSTAISQYNGVCRIIPLYTDITRLILPRISLSFNISFSFSAFCTRRLSILIDTNISIVGDIRYFCEMSIFRPMHKQPQSSSPSLLREEEQRGWENARPARIGRRSFPIVVSRMSRFSGVLAR
jgi:hypothetical protein